MRLLTVLVNNLVSHLTEGSVITMNLFIPFFSLFLFLLAVIIVVNFIRCSLALCVCFSRCIGPIGRNVIVNYPDL